MELLMRFGNISDNAASCLANALMIDLGIYKESLSLTPDKIRAMKEKRGKALTAKHLKENCKVLSVGLDGKRSLSKLLKNQYEVKDLQTLIDACKGTYLDVIETLIGTGFAIALKAFQVSLQQNFEFT